MKDFKWCVWAMPPANHEWNNWTNGFPVHMTVRHNLTFNQAVTIANAISNNPIQVRLTGEVRYTIDDGFAALAMLVEPNEQCEWWPDDAHISFRYRYEEGFSPEEIDALMEEITTLTACLINIRVVQCSGDYRSWGRPNSC